jgi:hypothetical protein
MGRKLPENTAPAGAGEDLLLRKLDCTVIEFLHQLLRERKLPAYDSVRGLFFEGPELYPNAGFREKNHTQICVRNPRCIRGVFIPPDTDPPIQLP